MGSAKCIIGGVEYESQRKYLADKSCDIYQGYLFSKPINKDDYASYIR